MKDVDVRLLEAPGHKEIVAVSQLLAAVGMRRRAPEAMRRAIDASQAVAVARVDDIIVGFGRLVGDGVYYGSLWDVAVSPAVQRRGVGSSIVDLLLRVARRQKLQIVGLFTESHNNIFYERRGFKMLGDIHPMTTRMNRRAR